VHADLLQEWDWQGSPQTYSDDYSGFALFVSHDSPDLATSLRCASAIGARLRRMGFLPARHHANPPSGTPREVADAANAVHYYDKLVVLYRTTLPAVLFEAGVIKNRDEELLLHGIATGIATCPDAPAAKRQTAEGAPTEDVPDRRRRASKLPDRHLCRSVAPHSDLPIHLCPRLDELDRLRLHALGSAPGLADSLGKRQTPELPG
jgi:hypothetical protein